MTQMSWKECIRLCVTISVISYHIIWTIGYVGKLTFSLVAEQRACWTNFSGDGIKNEGRLTLLIFVQTNIGHTHWTCILLGAYSYRIHFEKWTTNAFVAPYNATSGAGNLPKSDAILIISPVFLDSMEPTTAAVKKIIDEQLTLTILSKSWASNKW